MPVRELRIDITHQTPETTLRMADAQVTLCWVVLANLVANVLSFVLPLGPFSGIMLIFIAIAAFGSYRTLFGQVWAIVLTILTFVPIVGFLTVIACNSVTTKRLRAAGLHVGFMGVSGEDRDALRAALASEIAPTEDRNATVSVLDVPDA